MPQGPEEILAPADPKRRYRSLPALAAPGSPPSRRLSPQLRIIADNQTRLYFALPKYHNQYCAAVFSARSIAFITSRIRGAKCFYHRDTAKMKVGSLIMREPD
ncbi:hypothetical protein E2C01_037173 [Portunus trituberculatus]|uniref:Uncharacterized protein n=1 Tax=Portunus trituberculatus TaxID=210409 RepID=A0A5B7FGD3_PORTR|nr:hypothetical protein [Portunus trituberculatus]